MSLREALGDHDLTWEELRAFCDELSDHVEDWQGVPIPLGEETPLVLNDRHPLRSLYESMNHAGGVTVDFVVDDRYDEHEETFARICTTKDVRDDERVVNEWYSRKRQCRVLVIQRAGRAFCVTIPVSPDRSMDRLSLWLQTIGAADAWDLDAEYRARLHLADMLSERQWRHYDLTGSRAWLAEDRHVGPATAGSQSAPSALPPGVPTTSVGRSATALRPRSGWGASPSTALAPRRAAGHDTPGASDTTRC